MKLGILVATCWEVRTLIRSSRVKQETPSLYRIVGNELELWLKISGIGPSHAKQSAKELLDLGSRDILSTGFAAALRDGIECGDFVLDRERSDPDLVSKVKSALSKTMRRVHEGQIVDSPKVVLSSQEKRSIGEKNGAIALDMEGQAISEFCRENQIPYCSVRVISDSVNQDLPSCVTRMGSDGKISAKFFRALLGTPQDWIPFLRLIFSFYKAEKNLSQVLCHFQEDFRN